MKRALDIEQIKWGLQNLLIGGLRSASEACRELQISQSTFSRLIKSFGDDVVSFGKGSKSRYAFKREIKGLGRSVPVFSVSAKGKAHHDGTLHFVKPQSLVWVPTGKTEFVWYPDLPYFLSDLRPSGFLGRMVPLTHSQENYPEDIRFWSADHCLHYLANYGSDNIGNLIVGEKAFQKSQEPHSTAKSEKKASSLKSLYLTLVQKVLAHGNPGSSAAGEQPKFLTRRPEDGRHVLVKFSARRGEAPDRHIDLLLSEYWALEVLRKYKIKSAKACIHIFEERFFLEVERFDRIEPHGRRGLITIGTLDAQFVGSSAAEHNWTQIAASLAKKKIISPADARLTHELDVFGSLIANEDRHGGNLSFFFEDDKTDELAPVYDMLPMRYMPIHGQVPKIAFDPIHPNPLTQEVWQWPIKAATDFWESVADDRRVSEDFRQIARENQSIVKERRSELERMIKD